MAKKTYVGVNNIARNVSKMYVGVNGVARKVKKAYVGVNGVARLVFRKKDINPSNLSVARKTVSAKTSDYVFFAGGYQYQTSSASKVVDVYDEFITKVTTNLELPLAVYSNNGGSIESSNLAIFAGGFNPTNGSTNNVTAFTNSLTRTSSMSMSYYGCPQLGICPSVKKSDGTNEYILIAMAYNMTTTNQFSFVNKMEVFDKSLTRIINVDGLSFTTYYGGGEATQNHALFCGGITSSSAGSVSTVNAYDSSLTRWEVSANLSSPKANFGIAHLNGNVIVASGGTGQYGTTYGNKTVDMYNDSFTRTSLMDIPIVMICLASSSNDEGEYVAFACGLNYDNDAVLGKVYSYDKNFTQHTLSDAKHSRAEAWGASISGYSLIAGGYDLSSTDYNDLDVYDSNGTKVF